MQVCAFIITRRSHFHGQKCPFLNSNRAKLNSLRHRDRHRPDTNLFRDILIESCFPARFNRLPRVTRARAHDTTEIASCVLRKHFVRLGYTLDTHPLADVCEIDNGIRRDFWPLKSTPDGRVYAEIRRRAVDGWKRARARPIAGTTSGSHRGVPWILVEI